MAASDGEGGHMAESVDKHMRRRRVAVLWAGTASVCLALVTGLDLGTPQTLDAWQFSAVLTITGALLWSSLHPTMRATRLVHDLSTPLLAVAIITYGRIAPLFVLLQVAIAELVASRQQRHTPTRAVTVLGQSWLLATALILGAATQTPSVTRLGVLVAAAIALNYFSVLATMRYVHGPVVTMADGAGKLNAIEWAVTVAAGAASMPSTGWAVAAGGMLAWMYLALMEHRRAEHVAALTLELQARIVTAERLGEMSDHTERVVETVRAMLRHLGLDHRPTGRVGNDHLGSVEGNRGVVEAAAWIHSLSFGGFPQRCNGRARDPVLDIYANSLPSVRSVRRLLEGKGFPAPSADLPVHVIAAACAWDSRRLPASPITSPDDVAAIYGIDPTVVGALEASI